MLIDCCWRVIHREQHDTLSNALGKHKVTSVCFFFMQMYRNCSFGYNFFVKRNVDWVMNVPFTKEISDFENITGADFVEMCKSVLRKYKVAEEILKEDMIPIVEEIERMVTDGVVKFEFPGEEQTELVADGILELFINFKKVTLE